MNLILLGLGYKVVANAMQSAPSSAPTSTAPAQALAPDAQPGAVMQKGLITPVQHGDGWGSDIRHRKAGLRNQAWDVGDVDMTSEGYLEEIYGGRAVPAESEPMTIGPKEDRLHNRNKVAKSYAQTEAAKDRQIYEAEVTAEYYDVDDASQDDVVRQKVKNEARWNKSLAMDAALDRKAQLAEKIAQDTDARMNERASTMHGKMIMRSIKRTVSPDMDMALRQEYQPQARRGFQKRPDAPFEDAQSVSLREGNFTQTEVVPADDFENHLSAGNLGFKEGYKDWPQTVQQKSRNSDFSGVLVNEKGSADFSHDIVYDVDSDFGG